MGTIYSETIEEIRERGNSGYIDPCMIMGSSGSKYLRFEDYRKELNRYKEIESASELQEKMRQEFMQKSIELEKLKADYLVAEKAVLEIINNGKVQTDYMKNMLNILQKQTYNAYSAICELKSEIDKKIDFHKTLIFQPEKEDAIRRKVLNELINTTLCYMREGLFNDNNPFKKVVSDCAEIIRCLENENYHSNDKVVFSYYLTETVGLKKTYHKCCNCGKSLFYNVSYCLNCYERNE